MSEVEYLKYRAFYGQSFYRTLIGNHTQSIEWYQLNDLELPLTRISRSRHFWSRKSEKRRVLKEKVTVTQDEK